MPNTKNVQPKYKDTTKTVDLLRKDAQKVHEQYQRHREILEGRHPILSFAESRSFLHSPGLEYHSLPCLESDGSDLKIASNSPPKRNKVDAMDQAYSKVQP